jgi:putative superfamily III holin-X
MAHDTLRDSVLVRAARDLLADLSDLVQKELRLARAELARKLSAHLQASVWMVVAALIGLLAGVLIVEGIVFALAEAGLPLHWSCFLVAAILATVAIFFFYQAKSAMTGADLAPTRSARQFSEAVRTAKEQLG